jgi:hypothetical protein
MSADIFIQSMNFEMAEKIKYIRLLKLEVADVSEVHG